ncbi:gluconate 2-dehydrogenase subunit 3 family protein [Gelidibacter salicanalis]|uniref:Gluconate 2-dehydrogenase subunit 3 family protein n=1 Tax=Gelidibacter salicanalis TaxID=291193 RepID=A0A934NKG3_9FLAO|nr:gluconate 2-dehydrogenase subunit 3 family protein [Gelidibacter salicanalis]MBJ7880442.1 gluconate 2-dehydrogenase subunit 3 family protein [Gelidibacter salicanalis]
MMNRRDALKNLGLSLGYVIATPTILSMLQSCTAQPEKWTPLFFSEKQAYVLHNLVDLILPKTKDAPGAVDVNVPKFIDLYTSKTATDEEKEIYRTGLDAVIEELGIPNEDPITLETKKFDAILSKYLRLTKAERLAYVEQENIVFETLMKIRDQSVWAYRSSKEIGKNVLAYDPIPGQQKGCISLDKATGGKAWSL